MRNFLFVLSLMMTLSLTAQNQSEKQKDKEQPITEKIIEPKGQLIRFGDEVPFSIIDKVPTFQGCKGEGQELKYCFNQKIRQHFGKNFDTDLPNELGLTPGTKRIIMIFVIDKEGTVDKIRVKAPHPKLKEEALRVLKLLPKMIPGEQEGKPTGVKYTLPMRITVEK